MAACLLLGTSASAVAQAGQPGLEAPLPAAREEGPSSGSAPSAASPAQSGSSLPAAPDDLKDGRPDWGDVGPNESLVGALLRMVLVLALVLAVIYLTLNYGLRKLMRLGATGQDTLRLCARLPIEPKKSVVLIEAADEFFLLGVGEREVTLLTRLDAERARQALARKPAAPAPARPFWERLKVKPPPKPPGGAGKGPVE